MSRRRDREEKFITSTLTEIALLLIFTFMLVSLFIGKKQAGDVKAHEGGIRALGRELVDAIGEVNGLDERLIRALDELAAEKAGLRKALGQIASLTHENGQLKAEGRVTEQQKDKRIAHLEGEVDRLATKILNLMGKVCEADPKTPGDVKPFWRIQLSDTIVQARFPSLNAYPQAKKIIQELKSQEANEVLILSLTVSQFRDLARRLAELTVEPDCFYPTKLDVASTASDADFRNVSEAINLPAFGRPRR